MDRNDGPFAAVAAFFSPNHHHLAALLTDVFRGHERMKAVLAHMPHTTFTPGDDEYWNSKINNIPTVDRKGGGANAPSMRIEPKISLYG